MIGSTLFTRKQLFIDDYMIEEAKGIRRVLNQPAKHPGNPILVAENPWEMTFIDMPAVAFDPAAECFKMCYRVMGPGPTGQMGDQSRSANICYAQSTDGVDWEKPNLGVREWVDGSKANNIIIRSALGVAGNAVVQAFGIDLDDPDPERRFKMYFKDQLGGKELPNYMQGIAFSPDCIHWREHIIEPYMIARLRPPGILNPRVRYVIYGQARDYDGTRKVDRIESDNFVQWSGSSIVLDRDLDDAPGTQFYGMATDPINSHTCAGLHFGLVQIYHTPPYGPGRFESYKTFPDIVDSQLAISRDGICWHRPGARKTFLPCGEPGAWDAGMVFASPPVTRGDTVYIFYGATKYRHAGPPKGEPHQSGIGLATLRVDGFVSVETEGSAPGWLLTRSFYPIDSKLAKDPRAEPYCVETSAIQVNADAKRGELRAEVLNQQGDVYPGYSPQDCDPIREDVVDRRLSWKGSSDLTALRKLVEGKSDHDQKFRLRFHLSPGTKLYSFELLKT